jgi:hypothetical protein
MCYILFLLGTEPIRHITAETPSAYDVPAFRMASKMPSSRCPCRCAPTRACQAPLPISGARPSVGMECLGLLAPMRRNDHGWRAELIAVYLPPNAKCSASLDQP